MGAAAVAAVLTTMLAVPPLASRHLPHPSYLLPGVASCQVRQRKNSRTSDPIARPYGSPLDRRQLTRGIGTGAACVLDEMAPDGWRRPPGETKAGALGSGGRADLRLRSGVTLARRAGAPTFEDIRFAGVKRDPPESVLQGPGPGGRSLSQRGTAVAGRRSASAAGTGRRTSAPPTARTPGRR